jgi:hypothetical protein
MSKEEVDSFIFFVVSAFTASPQPYNSADPPVCIRLPSAVIAENSFYFTLCYFILLYVILFYFMLFYFTLCYFILLYFTLFSFAEPLPPFILRNEFGVVKERVIEFASNNIAFLHVSF